MAARLIGDLIGASFILNRDAKLGAESRCQVWQESEGNFNLLAAGRTWEDTIKHLRNKAPGK